MSKESSQLFFTFSFFFFFLLKEMEQSDDEKPSGKKPVTWIPSASGDKFPIQIDLSHPLWQTFLESGSLSPTQFFRMFFSPPTYFHNPTPWRSRTSVRYNFTFLKKTFFDKSYFRDFPQLTFQEKKFLLECSELVVLIESSNCKGEDGLQRPRRLLSECSEESFFQNV